MKATKGRRLLSALLSLLMLVSLLPISVLADDATVTATQITQASELTVSMFSSPTAAMPPVSSTALG